MFLNKETLLLNINLFFYIARQNHIEEWEKVDQLHNYFHSLSHRVIEAIKLKEKKAVDEIMKEASLISGELFKLLDYLLKKINEFEKNNEEIFIPIKTSN